MATRHLSIRIDESTLDRLDEESRRTRQSRSQLAKTLIEEGLRMDAHPGIVFRETATGRRAPALARGPKVWVVARHFQGMTSDTDDEIDQIAGWFSLDPTEVRLALRYYLDYRSEVDAWIARNDEELDRAEAAWRREQQLLQPR